MTTVAGPVYTLDAVAEFATSAKEKAAALAATLTETIADLAQQLSDGDIEEGEFVAAVRAALVAAGQDAAAGLSDDAFVERLVEGRMEYLDGFAADISDGLSPAAIASRAANWAGLAWTAYQIAHVEQAANIDDPPMTWDGTDDEHTCNGCHELIGTTRRASEWDVYPGDLECGGHDRCGLVAA